MSADRTVTVGEYGHSKVRCDGFTDGRRCHESVTGAFRKGIENARASAADRGWAVGVRTQYASNGFQIRDYCPTHARSLLSVLPRGVEAVTQPPKNDSGVQYGVRLLVPHVNAGETVWFPDLWYAERSITPGLGALVTRPIPPAEP